MVDMQAFARSQRHLHPLCLWIAAHGVTVAASDTSLIEAAAGAVAVSGGFGGTAGVAVSIGLSIATNEITDPVTAYIDGVPSLTTNGGAVTVTTVLIFLSRLV